MVSIKELSEEDIKIKYITPAIQKSNWDIQTQLDVSIIILPAK